MKIIVNVVKNIVLCISSQLMINPYSKAPRGMPPFVIKPTIENIRDMYSLGVPLCIRA